MKTFVHPIVPVLDVTRPVVTQFNSTLSKRLSGGAHPTLSYLSFFPDLLSNDGKFNEEYKLDGTHLHPKYIKLMEREVNKKIK